MATKSVISGLGAGLVAAMLLTVCAVWAITPAQSTTEPSQTNMPSNGARSGPLPPTIWGFTYAVDGVTPLNGCTVAITEEATGEVVVWNESSAEWDPTLNFYSIWMGEFMDGWTFGDVLNVTAMKGALVGWNEAQITADGQINVDVTLGAEVFTMNLVTGWNFVSLPLVCYGYKASTLGLNPRDTVSEWNSTTKTYRSHIVGVPVNDFAISSGTGYEINVPSGTRTLTFLGVTPTASHSKIIKVPAGGGWATVGFVGLNTTRHASEVPAVYSVPGGITTVSTWNPVTKTYTNWLSVIPSLNDFVLTPGLAYWILASASGTLSYEPSVPLVASFTYTVDGLTVNVDASSSSDSTVSYTWDWGDGTTGSGMVGTHTYSPLISARPISRAPSVSDFLSVHDVWGYTYAADGTPLPYCYVTITNLRTGESLITTSSNHGYYEADLGNLIHGFAVGDILNVTATKSVLKGWTEAPVTSNAWDRIAVTLSGPSEIITLTVTDAIGKTDSMSKTVKLLVPPVASFTYTVDGLTVNVDASTSSGYDIVSYEWNWGDGATMSGIVGTRTYPASVNSTLSGPNTGPPCPPLPIFGWIYAADGVTVLKGCNVTLVNLRTGYSLTTTSDADEGIYLSDACLFENGYVFGDSIRVTATSGEQTGWMEFLLTDMVYGQADVTMGSGVVTIGLKVTDALGQTAMVIQTVVMILPPIA